MCSYGQAVLVIRLTTVVSLHSILTSFLLNVHLGSGYIWGSDSGSSKASERGIHSIWEWRDNTAGHQDVAIPGWGMAAGIRLPTGPAHLAL